MFGGGLFGFLKISFFFLIAAFPAFAQEPSVQEPSVQEPLAQTSPDALRSYRTGRDLEARDRLEEAGRYYEEAVRICIAELNQNPANMDSYTVLTWALRRQEKHAEVISWGERALRIGGSDYRIVETMGEAYFYLSQYDDSLLFMQRYVNSLPQGERAPVAYFFIGEIYRIQRKFRHADIAYTTALRLDPSPALWWYRLGSVRESAEEYAPAAEAYERALRINPAYEEARQGLDRSRRAG
jgi:tetratricopeptide (TPR) repeat protein